MCSSSVSFQLSSTFKPYFDEHFVLKLKWVDTYFIQGINRGIFGVPSAKKFEIEGLVKQLESQNPTPDPTLNLEKVCFHL
jgi:hypothetical protein